MITRGHGFDFECVLFKRAAFITFGAFAELLLLVSFSHWGRVMHICVRKLTIIGSDNGLSPGRRQAIIWTNAVILSTGPLGTNVSEILIEIYAFSFKKLHLKMPSEKWRPSCLGLNVLITASFWYVVQDKKPSPAPMLTTIHHAIRRHYALVKYRLFCLIYIYIL